jgi:chromosome partitioning protein
MYDIVGIAEIAELLEVTPAAVTNWRKRYPNFPRPIADLKSGPVFKLNQVLNWMNRRKKMTTKVVATINLKGGVAKTTTTVGLAQTLSGEFDKNVLVIDLDTQTNATSVLIGEEKWLELDKNAYTLATLFNDAVHNKSEFSLSNSLQRGVGNIDQVKTVDLLPSSLRLIELQDRLITMNPGSFNNRTPIDILWRGIKEIINEYDFILIDCPPNLGFITLNGLKISDGYIIPTIPDILSTYGIPQIVNRIDRFTDEIGKQIVSMGILATKQRQIGIHLRTLERLRNDAGKPISNTNMLYPRVFNTTFLERAETAEAAEYINHQTLKQKWGYRGSYESFYTFAQEFMDACEAI